VKKGLSTVAERVPVKPPLLIPVVVATADAGVRAATARPDTAATRIVRAATETRALTRHDVLTFISILPAVKSCSQVTGAARRCPGYTGIYATETS
jgi:hypothetical protein